MRQAIPPGDEAREPEPFQPPPGEFVRYEDGCTLVQLPGLVAFAWLAPMVHHWISQAARHSSAPLEELAEGWAIAAGEIMTLKPPPEAPELSWGLEDPERVVSAESAMEFLELARTGGTPPGECPPLRWARLAVLLMKARGDFSHLHHAWAAELAVLWAQDWKLAQQWTNAPILAAGKAATDGRKRATEAKQARLDERYALLCGKAREYLAANVKREAAVRKLAEEFPKPDGKPLSPRAIDEILRKSGIRWRKAR